MKIGLVRRGYSPTGGAERFLTRFANGLVEGSHEVVLFSDRQWPESAWDSSRHQSIRLQQEDGTLSPLAFADALEAARPKEHCDFLFSFERVWNCDAYRAGDGVHRAWLERRSHFEAPIKSWFRGRQKKHRDLLQLEASLFAPESGVRVVANSQMVKEEIHELYQLPLDHINVIVNGYDAEELSPDSRREVREKKRHELGIADEEQALLFAGSGWERKGLRFAMQAVAALRKDRAVQLLVAGTGKKPCCVPAESVQFLGGVKDLKSLYLAADLFVLPTLYDPFSNACLEASAHGLPVITTKANGFAEILETEIQGEAVDPGDAEALHGALRKHKTIPTEEQREEIRSMAAPYSVERNVRTSLEFIQNCSGKTGE